MNIIITLLIFALVLFTYLHVYYHLKTGNDLEVFEVSNLSKERLEEVCNLRQPLTFFLNIECFKELTIKEVEKNYNSFDIKLRDISGNNYSDLFLPIVFSKAKLAIANSNNFYSESNEDFLNDTSLLKVLKLNDFFLRPPALMNSNYDYILGSTDISTPLRYNLNYRNYFIMLEGSAIVKLTPPKNKKYLYPNYDYDNFEFKSSINPWNVQQQYKHDFSKIKCLDVTLEKGKILFIPSYWWYSIKFTTNDTTILNFKYKTYMNNLAILPEYIKYFLQKQNIKHNILDKIQI